MLGLVQQGFALLQRFQEGHPVRSDSCASFWWDSVSFLKRVGINEHIDFIITLLVKPEEAHYLSNFKVAEILGRSGNMPCNKAVKQQNKQETMVTVRI
ncbi:MAG: hypothetical protein MZU95_00790 [Desulfomicrobium escambiense]|nr:hypothetical protein [Desulfomicrobium escambiense]